MYAGIQSKKDPAHVMTEVYKAMQLLNCTWHAVNNFRVICMWYHVPNATVSPVDAYLSEPSPMSGGNRDTSQMDIERQKPATSSKPNTIFNIQQQLTYDASSATGETGDAAGKAGRGGFRVRIALSLYKVQQSIYLLDFQKVDVSVTRYVMCFCVFDLCV